MSKKLVIVGDGMVGKTALLQSFVKGGFLGDYTPTVFETTAEEICLADGRSITLSLWDTGGQEEFDQIRQLAYPGAAVILLCYAIDCRTSLHNVIHTWNKEVRHFCPSTPVILVGCKSDLRCPMKTSSTSKSSGVRKQPNVSQTLELVDPNEAVQIQKEIGATVHIECSAMTRSNVITIFHLAAEAVLNSMKPNRNSILAVLQPHHTSFQRRASTNRRQSRTPYESRCFCCFPVKQAKSSD